MRRNLVMTAMLMAIAVKQPTPELATGVAAAVVRQFLKEEIYKIQARATHQRSYDAGQLNDASNAMNKAKAALLAYTRAHPGAPQSQTDSSETTLLGNLALAQARYADADAAYNASTAAAKPAKEDWFAVTVQKPIAITRVVVAHGRTEHNGGWFDASAGANSATAKGTSSRRSDQTATRFVRNCSQRCSVRG